MRRAAAALGVSLDAHRATEISEALVATADVVYVMDYLNEADVLSRFPTAKRKVRLLGACLPGSTASPEILDPFTDGDEATKLCASRIERCVSHLHSLWSAPSTRDA